MEHAITDLRRSGRPTIPTRDELVDRRVARLVAANAKIARDKKLFRSDRERLEAAIMVRPVDAGNAFGTFGLLIGSLPLATVSLRIAILSRFDEPGEQLFAVLFALAALATGVVGFRLGKYVAVAFEKFQDYRLPNRIMLYSLTGLAWGCVAGIAGGGFILVIGAFFGAIIGGFVGALMVPVFSILFELLRRGDRIETKHLLPIAVGLSLILCAFLSSGN